MAAGGARMHVGSRLVTLGATHWLAQNQVNAWWLMLAAVVVLLTISLRRETRKVR